MTVCKTDDSTDNLDSIYTIFFILGNTHLKSEQEWTALKYKIIKLEFSPTVLDDPPTPPLLKAFYFNRANFVAGSN